MVAATDSREQLQNAFKVFTHQSNLLEQSYRDLQGTVSELRRKLDQAQSARLAEVVKHEQLGAHLSHVLDSLPGAIVVLDGSGCIRHCNGQAANFLHRPLIGCSWATVIQREAQADASEGGNIQLRDGRWLSLSRNPLRHESGELLLLADVTESRNLSDIQRRQERLTAIGEMTAKFAHEVRTPLASALLYVAQLDNDSCPQRPAAQKIRARLNDLGRMVDDMLRFAAGTRPAEALVNVYELLTEIQVGTEIECAGSVDVTVDVSDHRLSVRANRDAIKGALSNLVNNAIQACGEGARIRIRAAQVDDRVVLAVRDNGPGIDPDILPKIFDPFFTTRPQGTGLGLSVVQAVANAHGGAVAVTGTAPGTEIQLSLPAPPLETRND
ncbi:MAG: ATP-binding protein [Pseudomonadota bacterium]